ncbi:MAG TPA: hypothetical protein VHZ07_19365 [Bryobacteraceae bacterium]|jgi:hypothetical protein|nr:hypothetical protein [Bryobacteraceae bacterium]
MGNSKDTQPDKNAAANERPVPSQAEGDRKTVEEDLKRKEEQERAKAQTAGSQQK